MEICGIDMPLQVVAKRIRRKRPCSVPRLVRQIFTSSSDIAGLRYRRNKIGSDCHLGDSRRHCPTKEKRKTESIVVVTQKVIVIVREID